MLIDFHWFRTFSDDSYRIHSLINGGFIFSLIGKQNYLIIGMPSDSIAINLKLNGLILDFGIR